jgi:hypothetical protein
MRVEDELSLPGQGKMAGFYEQGNKPAGSIQAGN